MMDLITHLPLTPAGHDAIAKFVDRLSKYVYFIPCSGKIMAKELAHLFICSVVCNHGIPSKIISDRNPTILLTLLVNAGGCTEVQAQLE